MLCVIKRKSRVQDGHRLRAITMPFYLRDLSIQDFGHLRRVLEPFPEDSRGTPVYFPIVLIENTLIVVYSSNNGFHALLFSM